MMDVKNKNPLSYTILIVLGCEKTYKNKYNSSMSLQNSITVKATILFGLPVIVVVLTYTW